MVQEPQKPTNIGTIKPILITEEMKKSYLDYAMSVIVSRALPDVRDGLKPSQRRVIVAMHDLNLSSNSTYRKCAKIAGDTSGNYHPHGEAIVYPTLVRLAQTFNMRYPLIDGQGNFGSIDGDPPAAMRYTEARLTKFCEAMLTDLDKDTVDWVNNFDNTRKEPTVLPSKFPNLLLNGTDGIAVGMATKIPPHNLNEVVDALVFIIENAKIIKSELENHPPASSHARPPASSLAGEVRWEASRAERIRELEKNKDENTNSLISNQPTFFQIESDATVEDLMQFIKGPDFPTGGQIYDIREITQTYTSGHGRILMRGKAEIQEKEKNRLQVIISELPYQQNKASLVAKIAELVREKKITDISDLRDESDREGIRIAIDLKSSANPQKVLNQLYKFTPLQLAYHANMVALVEGQPRLLNLKNILLEHLKHRQKVVTRKTFFELQRAKYKAHILEGLKIALDNLDDVVETIKKSKNTETAKTNLIKKFKLTEIQAQAILDMQLKRLTALERKQIEDDLHSTLALITELEQILSSPKRILELIKKESLKLKEDFTDERKTKVYQGTPDQISEEDLIKDTDVIVTLTRSGYIKRLSLTSFRSQIRGGKGVSGASLKEEDVVTGVLTARTLDNILFFTNFGRAFSCKIYEIPETGRTARGQALVNLIGLEQNEKVTSVHVMTPTQ